jgi:uncharacterized protein
MPRNRNRLVSRALDAALPVALLLVLAAIGYVLFIRPHTGRVKHLPEKTRVARTLPAAPVTPQHTTVQAHRPAAPLAALPSKSYRARVAIVIDDIGSDMAAVRDVLDIDAPLSVAVLPDLPYSKRSAAAAEDAGRDVLLHLPMQPLGDSTKGLGPGALMDGMDETTIVGIVESDLSSVPGVVGVNNHMGSYLTEDRESMDRVMQVIGRHGLFFLDSRTSAASVALKSARAHGVPSASRNVFLDDSSDEAEIRHQFQRLVNLSLKNGEAIAIGHPHPATLRVLREEIPLLREKGIEVVRVSKLMR